MVHLNSYLSDRSAAIPRVRTLLPGFSSERIRYYRCVAPYQGAWGRGEEKEEDFEAANATRTRQHANPRAPLTRLILTYESMHAVTRQSTRNCSIT